MVNTIIVSAVGNKSKPIKKQILVEVAIGNQQHNNVFMVILNLIRLRIIGISILKENDCIINLKNGVINLLNEEEKPEEIPMCKIMVTTKKEAAELRDLELKIDDKIKQIEDIGVEQLIS